MKTSPEALAIASFTFAVALLLGGWQHIGTLVAQVLWSGLAPELDHRVYAVVTFAIIGAVVAATLAVARRAGAASELLWAQHLTGAAVLLCALMLVAVVVAALGSLTGQQFGLPLFPWLR